MDAKCNSSTEMTLTMILKIYIIQMQKKLIRSTTNWFNNIQGHNQLNELNKFMQVMNQASQQRLIAFSNFSHHY